VQFATGLSLCQGSPAINFSARSIQVVATSLPAIQSALAIRPDEMSWIQTAYLIAEVIAIPLTGSTAASRSAAS
jgi:DHA2 family multidrug resistance protein